MLNKVIIGIPTFNRQQKCWQLLLKLSSIDKIFESVQIVVVDNSTNNRRTLLEDNCSKISEGIIYFHNGENKGLDYSILRLINFAKKIIQKWLLSDDDEIFLDGIRICKFYKDSKSPVNLLISR